MTKKPNVVVIGARGMLGSELCRTFPEAIGFDVREGDGILHCDITNETSVRSKLGSLPPGTFVINAAAYTNVNKAEIEPEAAELLNATGPMYIGKACRDNGLIPVQISTDFVVPTFEDRRAPYHETEIFVPNDVKNVYGRTKLMGEQSALGGANGIVIRTAYLYGNNDPNCLVDKMWRFATTGGETFGTDTRGSLTYTGDLAAIIEGLITARANGDEDISGYFHGVNTGLCSPYEVAQVVAEMASEVRGSDVRVTEKPIENYEAECRERGPVALFPRFSGLAMSRFTNESAQAPFKQSDLGIPLRPWDVALRDYLEKKIATSRLP